MREFNAEEIRQKYDEFAPQYSERERLQELLGVRRLRSDLLQRARGKVLEIAAGAGANFPYYPSTCQVTAIDLSRGMLEIARARAKQLGLNVTCLVMNAEALDFPGETFDTVVSSLSTCTFPDPVAALTEMTRVCRADGRVLLLEHGRSTYRWAGRLQDRLADRHAARLACHWNREPLDLVHKAGLKVLVSRRHLLGIYHVIEAQP